MVPLQLPYLHHVYSFLLGPSNYNGMAVFDCVPAQGTIGPGKPCKLCCEFLSCLFPLFELLLEHTVSSFNKMRSRPK